MMIKGGVNINNKLKPLEQWYCDSCKELIEDKEEGYLEWIHISGEIVGHYSYTLTHNKKSCTYDQTTLFKKNKLTSSGDHLTNYVGPDGLLVLLEEIEDNRAKENKEIIEIIKRLHIPYYEEARLHITEAEINNEFDGMSPVIRAFQSINKRLIEKYSN